MATTTNTPTTLQERLAVAQAALPQGAAGANNALPENGAGEAYSDLLDEILWLKDQIRNVEI